MKFCQKCEEEPEGLQLFRRKNPRASWDQFKDEAQTAYSELLDTIIRDQKSLCSYCEIDLVSKLDQMVEHFHPKSDVSTATNWGLAWTNLLLCCKGGNAPNTAGMRGENRVALEPKSENLHCDIKGDKIVDEEVINPLDVPKHPSIWKFISSDGSLEVCEPACVEHGIPIAKALRTIEEFNLNSPTLRRSRQSHYNQVQKKIKLGRTSKSGKPRRQTMENLVVRYLATNEGKKHRFFTTSRHALGRFAEEYLLDSDDF